MKKFFTLKRARNATVVPGSDRARLALSMPAETAALASVRLGGMSL